MPASTAPGEALKLVEDGDAILLDAGTTVFESICFEIDKGLREDR